ncbi:MAG: LysR substrate-binding domain-containing protein, partial [Pseudomonadota bacterium]
LLPSLVRTVGETYGELELDIRETITPRLIEELMDGALDAAIVALPVSEHSLTEVALFREAFVLVRPLSEADRPVPAPELLRESRLLLLEEGHCFRDQALAFCDVRAAGAQHGFDGSSLSTLVQMVGAGMGVTLIPEMAQAVETRSAPVAVGRFAEPQPSRVVGMVWRKTSPLADELVELSATISQAAGELGTSDADPTR